ncbi:MAG TPA: thrombospondin type 3 repeat-containing protein [Chthoniobacterales bacterium]|jgi:hypothetical protein
MLPTFGGRAGRLLFLCAAVTGAQANTSITFTRADIANMAVLWETDCISISSLANSQYPNVAGTWDFIVPHTTISSDGDVHTDMAIDGSGTGGSSNNVGESPIVCEVINATANQLSHLDSLTNQQAMFRGIFRFYTEHAGERHFELHPVTQLQRWNGSTFVSDSDYHSNIVAVPDGTSHANSTLIGLLNGSQTIAATITADNNSVMLNCPSPSVNYVQYDGVAVSGLTSDAVSQYFLFQPDLVPGATVRCRVVSNTAAAATAAGLVPNETVTVNALTRTDMAAVNTQVQAMSANQQKTFARPVEFILLGLPNLGPPPTPTPAATTFINSNSIAILTNSHNPRTAGSPYPSTIAVTGVPGLISKVSVGLNDINTSSQAFPSDVDILMVGPTGQNTMLMSDAGGGGRLRHVDLDFNDDAAGSLSTSQITTGTYRPTNYDPAGDADLFPAPAPVKPFGATLSLFNGTPPNGTWNLFVLDEYIQGSGSIAGGWSVTISTMPAAPLITTATATNLKSTSATLNGTINPLGESSSYGFQMGADTNYPFAQEPQSGGNGTAPVNAAVFVSGLHPATTYHYRLTGSNSAGLTFGGDVSFTTPALVDSDGDGMPNDYETAVGLNPSSASDAALDRDGDGMTNLQEYQTGTDPNSAENVLRITSIEITGGDAVITFPSMLGKTYQLEQRASLFGPWMSLTDNIPGTGSPISVPDVEAADENTKRFYRITLMP